MLPAYITPQRIQQFIATALEEDVGEGDHSTLAAVPDGTTSRARLLVKEGGLIAGITLAKEIFNYYSNALHVTFHCHDGDAVQAGDVAFIVEGPARAILTTERLVLNSMQRMSGIATFTHKLAAHLVGTNTRLLDTRKTTPNFRMLEKWAVHIGGGQNHRFGLYDMVMLKDNHVDMAGGIAAAINRTKDYLRSRNKKLLIEIETRNLNEVEQVLQTGGVDIIMLDNMDVADMQQAVKMIAGRYKTEASGSITEANIKSIAACGVDFVSVGALTHSVKSLDLSLKVF
mgnify:CR=1 FL=1